MLTAILAGECTAVDFAWVFDDAAASALLASAPPVAAALYTEGNGSVSRSCHLWSEK